MKTTAEIIEYVGRDRLAGALGVKDGAIRHAAKSGIFPASWYDSLERLCGRPLDRALFSFKGAAE